MTARCPVGFTVSANEDTQDYDQWLRDLDAIEKLGGNAVRVGLSPWMSETHHIAHFKRCLEEAKRRNFVVMVTTSQLVDNDENLDTAKAMQDASTYMLKIGPELAPLADWWQILNEHDMRDWRNWERELWDTTPGTEEEEFEHKEERIYMDAEYLETVRAVISLCASHLKGYNPKLKTLTAVTGVSANTDSEPVWRRFYSVVGSAVDDIGFNLYPIVWWDKYLEMPTRLRRTSQALNNKRILISEIGLPSMTLDNDVDHGEWIAAQVDRASRADIVDGVWLYELRDSVPVSDPEYQNNAELRFGVLNSDGTDKTYTVAIRAMIKAVRA